MDGVYFLLLLIFLPTGCIILFHQDEGVDRENKVYFDKCNDMKGKIISYEGKISCIDSDGNKLFQQGKNHDSTNTN